jgi:hypothetical protein
MKGSAVAALAFLMVGCSTDARDCPDASGESDCTPLIRSEGITYTQYGHTDLAANKHGTADEADCDDEGPDACGSVFPDNPRQVAVWTFPGYPPDRVLGVRFKDSFDVFIAASVPRGQAERLLRKLQTD